LEDDFDDHIELLSVLLIKFIKAKPTIQHVFYFCDEEGMLEWLLEFEIFFLYLFVSLRNIKWAGEKEEFLENRISSFEYSPPVLFIVMNVTEKNFISQISISPQNKYILCGVILKVGKKCKTQSFIVKHEKNKDICSSHYFYLKPSTFMELKKLLEDDEDEKKERKKGKN
jgi:hypothetical protein